MADSTTTNGRRKARSKPARRTTTDLLRGVSEIRLKDGRVRYRASVPMGRGGARTWTPLVETPELAAELRRRMLAKLVDRPLRTLTFREALNATREDFERRCRPGTVRWFKDQMPALESFFGRMLVSSISPQDVERFAAQLIASKLSPSSVLHRRRGLRAVLSYVRDQLTNGDPMNKVRRGTWPKLRRGRVSAPEPATIRDFLRQTSESGSPRARVDHDLVAALYLTGLRRSELARLRAEDLRPQEGRIWVQGKNRDEWLPVNSEAMAVLQRMAARVDDKGTLVEGGTEEIHRVLRTRSARIGVKLSPHMLRRAFVTALIRAGHDVATVARYSRHTTDEIQRYMAANEDDRRVLAAVSIEESGKPPRRNRARLRKVE